MLELKLNHVLKVAPADSVDATGLIVFAFYVNHDIVNLLLSRNAKQTMVSTSSQVAQNLLHD